MNATTSQTKIGTKIAQISEAVAQPKTLTRLLYVDNLRTLLTIIVIAFHLMITYAGTGSWYYKEGQEDMVTGAFGAWFLVVNQCYFMGLFLLISAYFVPGSYDRKGAGRFLKERLVRLGIPLALYSWVIRPLFMYVDQVTRFGMQKSFINYYFGQYYHDENFIGSGPLWFIEVLLIFCLVYAGWRIITSSRPAQPAKETRFPSNMAIVILAVVMGLLAFLVRLWLPIDYNFQPLNLQFPYFVQYIALFIVGLVAYRRNWLVNLPEKTGKLWLGIAVGLILFFWPMLLGGGALEGGLDPFKGRMHWQAVMYAFYEAFLCVSMSVGLIYLFRRHWNAQGRLAVFLSRNAYTAYLIHGIVIVMIALAFQSVALYPLLKWVVVSLVAVPSCFLLSGLIRKIPYTNSVL